MNARQAAVHTLARMEREDSYSNVLLDELLKSTSLSEADAALAARLIYGVTERRLTLDEMLSKCAKTAPKRWHPTVRAILRTGAYQLLFMDKIPPSAAINESVKMAKSMRQQQASGFVNAVLHTLHREHEALWQALPDTPEGLAVRTSCPLPLLRLWGEAYGWDTAEKLAAASNEAPPAYIRVNTALTTTQKLCEQLEKADIAYEPCAYVTDGLRILQPMRLKKLAKSAYNWYYYQDMASQLCCRALGAQPGESIADVCAAPGGKSFTTALYMQGVGKVVAGDLYPAKCREMSRRAEQLGLSIVQVEPHDAEQPYPAERQGAFDRVICDAPCSGLGVIRRKPEIRYKDLASLSALPPLQQAVLAQASTLVKSGGVLQYSTCTLNPAENEQVAARFLEEHPDFVPRTLPLAEAFDAWGLSPSWALTLMPHQQGTDGFFIASFQRE